jgi:hypothetical protein
VGAGKVSGDQRLGVGEMWRCRQEHRDTDLVVDVVDVRGVAHICERQKETCERGSKYS